MADLRVDTDALRSAAQRIANQADDVQLAAPTDPSVREVGHARLADRLATFLHDSHRGVDELTRSTYGLAAWLVQGADEVEAADRRLGSAASATGPTHRSAGSGKRAVS